MANTQQKVALIVIDGWGLPSESSRKDGDAIAAANTPCMDGFAQENSQTAQGYTALEASSTAVGLPEGMMGNSEVGHLNIGAGRIVWQDVVRIDKCIKDGKLAEVENVKKSFQRAKDGNGRLHLCGLVSDGGVHSHINHLVALLKVAKQMEIPHVYIHFFGDGRDTDPKSGAGHLQTLIEQAKQIGVGEISTIVGRYYAMDRDKRWERVSIALRGMFSGVGEETDDPVELIRNFYKKCPKSSDEFLKPIIVGGEERRIKDDDTVFFFNYRSDRVRQVAQLLGGYDQDPADADVKFPKNIHLTTMTQYKSEFPYPIAFPALSKANVLADWLSQKDIKQCHIAETEKYAHVTFFFNGGVEQAFENETRDMVPSPTYLEQDGEKIKINTYDQAPEMSAAKVGVQMCERIKEGTFEFVMNNFAPPDMVGHTGVYEATIKGCEATDKAIEQVYKQCVESGYTLFVTADHGNAEEMLNEEGGPKTSHTTNKVPFVMANAPAGLSLDARGGVLGDVAPTILDIMGIEQPEDMTGKSLLVRS